MTDKTQEKSYTPKGYRIDRGDKYRLIKEDEQWISVTTGCEDELWQIREQLLAALKAYMFMEQTHSGLNPHTPGTNKHTAFELGRRAIESAERRP